MLGVGAGLLWVAQGSLLTACTTDANRGRWSGIFWASFMGGNAAGNISSSALIDCLGGDKSAVSTMFVVMAAIAALSSLSFALLVKNGHPVRTL